jgi:hypothetical protein
MEMRAATHGAFFSKSTAARTSESGRPVVMMKNGSGDKQNENQPVERETGNGQEPKFFEGAADHDGRLFGGRGKGIGHTENDSASSWTVTS